MRKITKQEKLIIACVALAVVLLILLVVAFNSCDNENTPGVTNPTGQTGEMTDPTGGNTTPEGTTPGGTTPDGTTPGGTTPDGTTPATTEPEEEIIPSVSLGIVDREEFGDDGDGTTPTTPTNPSTPTTPITPTTTPTTQPTEPPETTEPPTMPEVEGIELLTWEEYSALTGKEQRAYKESFPNRDDYYAWLDAAQAAYKEKHESEFGGNVDIGDILNGNNSNP